jgi:hypothetical protein
LIRTWTKFGFAFRVANKERDALHKWLDAWVVIALAAWYSGVIEILRKTSELLRQVPGRFLLWCVRQVLRKLPGGEDSQRQVPPIDCWRCPADA